METADVGKQQACWRASQTWTPVQRIADWTASCTGCGSRLSVKYHKKTVCRISTHVCTWSCTREINLEHSLPNELFKIKWHFEYFRMFVTAPHETLKNMRTKRSYSGDKFTTNSQLLLQLRSFKLHSKRTYVNPPRPIIVKKLIANLVFFGLSRGKIPSK